MTTLSYVRNGKAFEVEVESLPPVSVEYLLNYGWGKSLQDAIAGPVKKVKDEYVALIAEAGSDEVAIANLKVQCDLEVAATIEGNLGKRFDAIVNGTINSGSTREPRDVLRAVAISMVKNAAAKVGKKLSKELLAAKVSELLETNRPGVQREYEEQKAREVKVEINFD